MCKWAYMRICKITVDMCLIKRIFLWLIKRIFLRTRRRQCIVSLRQDSQLTYVYSDTEWDMTSRIRFCSLISSLLLLLLVLGIVICIFSPSGIAIFIFIIVICIFTASTTTTNLYGALREHPATADHLMHPPQHLQCHCHSNYGTRWLPLPRAEPFL